MFEKLCFHGKKEYGEIKSSARNYNCAGLLVYTTLGIRALQPRVAEMSITKINTNYP